ncbi:MAG: hypothetical protein IKW83_00495 [Muribaculaceae bacterium]|nr:hypothetical protein [Muribaculaceae bacterium]
MSKLLKTLLLACVALLLEGCFTGVESTKKITEKDVQRAIQQIDKGSRESSLSIFVDSILSWHEGKGFWCVDNQARLIFNPSTNYDLDTLDLQGKMLTYSGYGTHKQLDNSEVVDIYLNYGPHRLVYPTGKTMTEINRHSFSMPFLIDDDMVQNVANQLESKTVYIKTAIWYDIEGCYQIGNRRFIPVVITAVKPGDKVYPLKVEFCATDNGDKAFVWMKPPGSESVGRDFDSLFSWTDVRKQYPDISPVIWSNIVNCRVAEGMTKAECRLAMGNPSNIMQLPDQSGLREYWYYEGGRYLFFVDGLLKEFR